MSRTNSLRRRVVDRETCGVDGRTRGRRPGQLCSQINTANMQLSPTWRQTSSYGRGRRPWRRRRDVDVARAPRSVRLARRKYVIAHSRPGTAAICYMLYSPSVQSNANDSMSKDVVPEAVAGTSSYAKRFARPTEELDRLARCASILAARVSRASLTIRRGDIAGKVRGGFGPDEAHHSWS
jgi:hypothetical protein